MSYTGTQTQSWTITHARYVTSKIAADLDIMRSNYGSPSEMKAADFAEEAAQLLAKRYLKTVEYGFKRDGKVIFALKYTAQSDGTLSIDDRPGRVPAGLNMQGASFYSYLTHSQAWWDLDSNTRSAIVIGLPVQRSSAAEPETGYGYWEENRTYSKSGEGVRRQVFRTL